MSRSCCVLFSLALQLTLIAVDRNPVVYAGAMRMAGPDKHFYAKVSLDTRELTVDVTGDGNSMLQWNVNTEAGLVVLSFEMRTSVNGELGEYIAKWIDDGEAGTGGFERIPLIPDGEWHDYRLPMGTGRALKAVQLILGAQPHAVALRNVTLTSLDSPKQVNRSDDGSFPAETRLETDAIQLRVKNAPLQFVLKDKRTGRVWESSPVSGWLVPVRIVEQSADSLTLELHDLFADKMVQVEISVAGDRCRFAISGPDMTGPFEAARHFPPQFRSLEFQGDLVFCDRSGGTLLDQHDTTYSDWPLRVYGNLHCLDMPWIGVVGRDRVDGMLVLFETPGDVEVSLQADTAGQHWPTIGWLPERDRFGYQRVVSYQLQDSGGYVGLAKRYRRYLKETGRWRSLQEKMEQTPNVAKLKGAPSLWGWPKTDEFVSEMRPLGVRRGVVNTCEDPKLAARMNAQGYLTGSYDSYTDFLEGEQNFQRDEISAAVVSRPGGQPKHGWMLESGDQMYWRSSALWQAAEGAYVDRHLRHTGHTSRFIDVAAAAELMEDYHPQHPLSRRDDLRNRIALFERFYNRNLVLGAEHGNDWVLPYVSFLEGAQSGPFWWSSWEAGYLKTPRPEQLTEKYRKYGMGHTHRIPLWELVYHDAAVSTWYWGDNAGLLYQASPELARKKDLFNILYGTVPLIWMNGTGYRYPDQTDRMLATYHETTHWHAAVAFSEMLIHECLTDDATVQRTRFANGCEAIVNFADTPRDIVVNEETITLAPFGYYAHGPGFRQSCQLVDGTQQTIISGPDILLVDGNGASPIQNILYAGRATCFRSDGEQWSIVLNGTGDCVMNLSAVTGWDAVDQLAVYEMNPDGSPGKQIAQADWQGTVTLPSTVQRTAYIAKRLRTDANQLTPEEKRAGFERLFNGVDLKDWIHSGNWQVENGSIFRHADGGFLTYGPAAVPDDFELRFEWKVAPGSNSGVHYRPTQYEYQILDNQLHQDGKNPRTSAASLYFCMAPSQDVTRPAGQWNRGRVVCKGTVIQHWLNGQKVVDFDYTDPQWKHEVDLLTRLGGDLTARGQHLAFQDHLDPVWFRAIRIRSIPPEEPLTRSDVQPQPVSEENERHQEEVIQHVIRQRP